jgi:hypothetical protein
VPETLDSVIASTVPFAPGFHPVTPVVGLISARFCRTTPPSTKNWPPTKMFVPSLASEVTVWPAFGSQLESSVAGVVSTAACPLIAPTRWTVDPNNEVNAPPTYSVAVGSEASCVAVPPDTIVVEEPCATPDASAYTGAVTAGVNEVDGDASLAALAAVVALAPKTLIPNSAR